MQALVPATETSGVRAVEVVVSARIQMTGASPPEADISGDDLGYQLQGWEAIIYLI